MKNAIIETVLTIESILFWIFAFLIAALLVFFASLIDRVSEDLDS
jgi:hypothetical protein